MSLAGAGVLGWQVADRWRRPPPDGLVALGVFAVLLVVGELLPISIDRRGEREAINLSGVFAMALMLRWDVAIAVVVQAFATLLYGAIRQITWWKRLFNVGQYTLSIAFAGWAFHRFATELPTGRLDHDLIVGTLAAAAAFFVVNHTLMGVAFALLDAAPIVGTLIADLTFQASINGVAAASAPLVLVTADANPWLVALLLLPLAAIHRSAILSLRNEHQARHDALTGLPNGSTFRQLLTDAITEATLYGRHVAVLMIDVDDFTEVNDTLGHRVGDDVLREMATRLQCTVGDAGTVARFGGDEFSVVVSDLRSPLEATQLAERLLQNVQAPFLVAGSELTLKASVGLALFPQHGDTVDVLIQRADVALNVAKKTRAGLEIYSPDSDQYSLRRLAIFGQLPRAIAERELTLSYQPKADLRTGRIIAVEALLRWNHPELGPIAPDEFIGLAEHTGLIRLVTDYVLEEAVRQSQSWRAAGLDIPISVNLSAKDLLDAGLPNKVARLLAIYGIPAHALVVEVTETALMSDPDKALAVLEALHELHVRVSMDDFGTGYSSLAQLKRLPVDEVKIDRSFISNLEDDADNQVIVRSTIELAHNLGLEVVAEGVETEAEWQLLNGWNCDVAQGYLISAPVAAPDIQALQSTQLPWGCTNPSSRAS